MKCNKAKKKLGIIGGMGPKATYLFMSMIIDNSNCEKDQEHIPMIVLNDTTIPDRTTCILEGKEEEVLNILIKDGLMLQENGCDVIAVPCNTSHYFLDKVQEYIEIPIINMIRETVAYINESKPSVKKIGILATDGTISAGVYQKECEKLDIESYIPSKECQELVMDIIYNQIKKGKKGDYNMFKRIEQELNKNNCDMAILACTELSCFKEQYDIGDFYIDAMDVLVNKTIEICETK